MNDKYPSWYLEEKLNAAHKYYQKYEHQRMEALDTIAFMYWQGGREAIEKLAAEIGVILDA